MSWVLDKAHTTVLFSVRHMGIATVRGHFEEVSGSLEMASGLPTEIQADIPVAKVSTREPNRDNHLRSPDFFHAEQHPTLSFKSTRIEPTGGKTFKVQGDLTMRGNTHPVTLEGEATDVIKDPYGKNRVGLSAKGKLDRRQWGLTYGGLLETGALVVGHDINLDIEAEAVEQ